MLRSAAFAWLTASERPSSASLRSPWMSAVMPWSGRAVGPERAPPRRRWDVGGHAFGVLRQRLPGGEHAVARRARVGRGRERLHRGGEIVEDGLERVVLARLAEHALQPLEEVRALRRVGAAGLLLAQLALQVLIELARDRGEPHADRQVAGGGRDLRGGFLDVTRRLGVRDVRRDQRQPGLRDAQAADGRSERLSETHYMLLRSAIRRSVKRFAVKIARHVKKPAPQRSMLRTSCTI